MNGIQAQSAGRSLQLVSILRAQYSSGKISLPLDGGLYARLKHVQGIPSHTGRAGFSLTKLQMIDLMVDRLVRLRGEPRSVPKPTNDAEASDTLQSLARELHDTLSRSRVGGGSFASGLAEAGLLVNLVA